MTEREPAPNPLDLWRQFITDSERQWNSFFKDVLGSERASTVMNTWVETSLTVQRMVADNLERYYTTFNIPTHRDLVALGERMKAIEETLARVESALLVAAPQAASLRAPKPAAKPRRTKQPPALVAANASAAAPATARKRTAKKKKAPRRAAASRATRAPRATAAARATESTASEAPSAMDTVPEQFVATTPITDSTEAPITIARPAEERTPVAAETSVNGASAAAGTA